MGDRDWGRAAINDRTTRSHRRTLAAIPEAVSPSGLSICTNAPRVLSVRHAGNGLASFLSMLLAALRPPGAALQGRPPGRSSPMFTGSARQLSEDYRI
jgi:hypothetical protein